MKFIARIRPMKRRSLIGAVGAAFFGGCVGPTSGWEGSSRTPTDPGPEATNHDSANADVIISMTNEPAFNPSSTEVNLGDKVLWKNNSTEAHTVTADENGIPGDADYFASGGFSREVLATIVYPIGGRLRPGDDYTHQFETRGHYDYYSIPSKHRGMVGEIIVK